MWDNDDDILLAMCTTVGTGLLLFRDTYTIMNTQKKSFQHTVCLNPLWIMSLCLSVELYYSNSIVTTYTIH